MEPWGGAREGGSSSGGKRWSLSGPGEGRAEGRGHRRESHRPLLGGGEINLLKTRLKRTAEAPPPSAPTGRGREAGDRHAGHRPCAGGRGEPGVGLRRPAPHHSSPSVRPSAQSQNPPHAALWLADPPLPAGAPAGSGIPSQPLTDPCASWALTVAAVCLSVSPTGTDARPPGSRGPARAQRRAGVGVSLAHAHACEGWALATQQLETHALSGPQGASGLVRRWALDGAMQAGRLV